MYTISDDIIKNAGSSALGLFLEILNYLFYHAASSGSVYD